jgi:hypothetical protein
MFSASFSRAYFYINLPSTPIRRMDLRFVEESDPFRQALREIYTAVALKTLTTISKLTKGLLTQAAPAITSDNAPSRCSRSLTKFKYYLKIGRFSLAVVSPD